MHFSQRSGLDRRPNALTTALARHRAAGATPLDLTVTNPTAVGLPYATEAICRALADPAALRYQPAAFGMEAAREAVAASLRASGVEVTAERVVLTASTSEAYGLIFKLLCDPGDRVLVPAPSYPLLDHLAAFEALQTAVWPLRWDDGWWMDHAGLAAQVDARTRAVVLVSPNNPTGSFTRRDDLRWLAGLGLPIISDEVFAAYRLLPDDPRDRGGAARSVLELQTGLNFALGGLSKLVGLPQVKLGWMALGGGESQVREALGRLELMADAALSLGTPVQVALPSLLEAGAQTRAAICARIADNLDALHRLLGPDSAASALQIEGGWSAPVRLPATLTCEQWALKLLAEQGVLVHPGAFYGFDPMQVIVLSLLVPLDTFAAGVARIARAVAACGAPLA